MNEEENIETKSEKDWGYYEDDLIIAYLRGQKFTKLRVDLIELLNKFKEKLDEYGEEFGISDKSLYLSLENEITDMIENEVYKFSKERDD